MTPGSTQAGEPDAAGIADRVLACTSVARMHAGPAGSYLPGRRVPGVSIEPETVTVHVDLAYPATVADLVTEIRDVLAGRLEGRRLAITVEDVVLPDESPPGPGSADARTTSARVPDNVLPAVTAPAELVAAGPVTAPTPVTPRTTPPPTSASHPPTGDEPPTSARRDT